MKTVRTQIRKILPENCKAYFVGGCVRDKLLGIASKDIDVTVVGSTPAQMEEKGFQRVGKAFEVFIHPDLGHDFQFALARKENSTGSGHTDFECIYEGVTLMDDLKRRDFTMNAIAIDLDDENETYIDPFNGRVHLANGTLEIVGEHFSEDPLRMLRGFRFAAKYNLTPSTAFYFAINQMRVDNAYSKLSPERINDELSKVINSCSPKQTSVVVASIIINISETSHPLMNVLQEMIPLEHNPEYHPEGGVFVHTLGVVEKTLEALNDGFRVRVGKKTITPTKEEAFYAALCHDLGKAIVAKHNEPTKYHGHESEAIADKIFRILHASRLPKRIRKICKCVARYHMHVHNFDILKTQTLIRMALSPELAVILTLVSRADCEVTGTLPDSRYTRFMLLMTQMNTLRSTAANSVDKDSKAWLEKVYQKQHALVEQERKDLLKLLEEGV